MNLIELEADSVRYFSENDELAFFNWLQKISCVKKYEGRGTTLHIFVDTNAINDVDLRELLALFRRYQTPLAQLKIFDKPEFAGWFRDPRGYWHSEIFGS